MFGAHGDGLSWSVFMGEGSARASEARIAQRRQNGDQQVHMLFTGLGGSSARPGCRIPGWAGLLLPVKVRIACMLLGLCWSPGQFRLRVASMLMDSAQVEGQDKNPYGIFGGIARLARVLHFCPNLSAAASSARFPHPVPPQAF